jgi:hypothetical protein
MRGCLVTIAVILQTLVIMGSLGGPRYTPDAAGRARMQEDFVARIVITAMCGAVLVWAAVGRAREKKLEEFNHPRVRGGVKYRRRERPDLLQNPAVQAFLAKQRAAEEGRDEV